MFYALEPHLAIAELRILGYEFLCFLSLCSRILITSVKCESGDVQLTNMQLKPEALNALKLPVRVKAGFLGSVKLKVSGRC